MPPVATEFTPYAALAGGLLVGLAAVLALLVFGRIAGIAGIVARAMRPTPGDWSWRVAFLLGLLASPLLYRLATGAPVTQTVSGDLATMAVAGLLVGLGTALGSGCTSGHGVCGLARLSRRSLAAVATFMAAAIATVFVVRHVVGGGA